MTKPTLTPPKEKAVARQGQHAPGEYDLVACVVAGRVQLVIDGAHAKPPKEQLHREVLRVRLKPGQHAVSLATYYAKMTTELAALQAAEDKRAGITRKTPT